MKKNTYYFFYFLSLLTFLVIISIGCGGGSDLIIPAKETVVRPNPPISGEVINLYTETAEVSWQASREVESFNIYVNGVLKETISKADFSTAEVSTASDYKFSYNIPGLKKDSSYIVSIRSLSDKGIESDKSIVFQINTIESASTPIPPKTLSFVSSTLKSASISFAEGKYAAKYQIFIDGLPYTLDSKPVYVFEPGTYEILNLEPSTDYDISIKSINGYGVSDTSEVLTISTGSAPSKPATPEVVTTLDKSVNITWDTVLKATKYFVYVANITEDPSAQLSLYSTVTNTTAIISNLKRGTTYHFAVKAWNKYGDSPYSDTIEVTTKDIPDAPTSLSISDITLTSFKINWPAVPTANNYKIYKNDLFYASVNASAGSPEYTLGSLTSDETYEIEVSAVNEFGESDKSDTSYVHTLSEDGDPPVIPTGFTISASNIKPTSMILSWTEVPGTSNYRVYYNNVYGNTNNNSYQIDNLTPDTLYDVGIEAYNDFGHTPKQTDTFSTLSEPLPVAKVLVESKSKNFIKVNWTEADGANKYFVYCRRIEPTPAIITEDTVEVTTYSFNGLTSGATFEITIFSSYNSNRQTSINSGSNENQILVSTPSTPATPIIDPTINNLSQNSADISWGAVANADYYNVYRKRILSDPSYSLDIDSGTSLTSTSFTLKDLTVDSTYEILVTAVSVTQTGEHLESEKQAVPLSFRTLPNIPNAPANLRYDRLSKDKDDVTVYWEAPGSTSYFYVYAPGHDPERQKVYLNSVNLNHWTPSPGGIIPTGTTIQVSAYNYDDLNSGTSEIRIPLDELSTPPVIGVPYPNAASSDTQMFVNWDTTEISTAYSYIIRLYDEDAATYVEIGNNQTQRTMPNKDFTFTNLTPDNGYTVEVKKLKPGKGESFTSTKSFTTNKAPDYPVFEEITLADYSTKEITINWDSETPHALIGDYNTTTFEIYAKQSSSSNWKLIDKVPAGDIYTGLNNPAFTYTIDRLGDDPTTAPELTYDTYYDIKVLALNPFTNRETVSEDTYKTDYTVSKPYNVSTSDKGLYYIDITWEIEDFMTINGRPDSFLLTWDTGTRSVSGDTFEAHIDSLFEDTTYHISVTAVNETDTHRLESTKLVEKTGAIPDAPIISAVNNISSSSMFVDWSEGNNTDYYVVRLTDGTNEIRSSETVSPTEFTMTGLDYGTQYTIEVIAYNQYGNSTGTASRKVTTKAYIDVATNRIDTAGILSSSSPYMDSSNGTIAISDGSNSQDIFTIAPASTSIAPLNLVPTPDPTSPIRGVAINSLGIYVSMMNAGLNHVYAFDISGSTTGVEDDFNVATETPLNNWGSTYDCVIDEASEKIYALSEYGGNIVPDLLSVQDKNGASDGSIEIEVVQTDLTNARTLALDSDGYLLVGNTTSGTISIYDTNNSFQSSGTINITNDYTIDGVYGIATNFDGSTKQLAVACGNRIVFYSGTGSSYTLDSDLTLDSSNRYTSTNPDDGLVAGYSINGPGYPVNARGICTVQSGSDPAFAVYDSGNNQILLLESFQ